MVELGISPTVRKMLAFRSRKLMPISEIRKQVSFVEARYMCLGMGYYTKFLIVMQFRLICFLKEPSLTALLTKTVS